MGVTSILILVIDKLSYLNFHHFVGEYLYFPFSGGGGITRVKKYTQNMTLAYDCITPVKIYALSESNNFHKKPH